MKKYHHLTQDERVKISMLRQSKHSITQIALALGRSKSSVSRELKCNQAGSVAFVEMELKVE